MARKNMTRRKQRGGVFCLGGLCSGTKATAVEEPGKKPNTRKINPSIYGNVGDKNGNARKTRNTKNILRGLINKPEANRSANEKRLLEKAREIQSLSNRLNATIKNNETKMKKRVNHNANALYHGRNIAKQMMRTYAGSNLQKKLAAANGTIAKLEYLLSKVNKD